MNWVITRNLIVLVLSGMLSLGASAAEEEKPMEKSGGEKKAIAPIAGIVPLGVTITETALVATGWRASDLIGAAVHNDGDEEIGKVDDVIVSTDGTVTTVIVEIGGFLGIGEHLVAIPVKQFTQIAPKATLPGATKVALEKLPEFQYAT